ncbi:MAG: HDIG domain-containing metalloprotein [Caldisericaceae bacterium]
MDRESLYNTLIEKVHDENLIKHMLSVEAVMRALAVKFGEDEEKWGITGLLHDIDYEVTKEDPDKHSLIGAEWLKEMGLPEDLVHAVLAHNERHGVVRESLLDKALWVADPVTGFIIAVALVRPDKKLTSVELKSMKKKFKEKSFAAGANRDQIAACEKDLGIPLDDFLELALNAMQGISSELGL